MRTPYSWLTSWLDLHLPEIEELRDTPKGRAKARGWFASLMRLFESRRLTTPKQQKNYVVDVRNAIRSRWGENHPALKVIGFDEQTWTEINLATHDRIEARNQNTQFIKYPDAIVARAHALLSSDKSEWYDLAVGLGVAIGRRISELLGPQTTLKPKTAFSVLFSGQLKTRGEPFSFEIPTLCPAPVVLDAWGRLRRMLGTSGPVEPRAINQRYGRQCREAANRHFAGLIPPRHNEDPDKADLYMHLFRSIYATIAVLYYCPPRVNRTLFKAEIQGHRLIAETTDNKKRRAYTASRFYDDYAIADRSGQNEDGRKGIKLAERGVQILEALQPSRPDQAKPTPVIPMPPKPAKKPLKPAKHSWKISDPAYKALSTDWRASKAEHQQAVFERVLAFAAAARTFANILELPAAQIAPETLLDALRAKFTSLSTDLKEARDQSDKVKAQLNQAHTATQQLAAERDALSARITGLQNAARHDKAPPVELLPFARRLLELASRSGTLPPDQLRDQLMQLAIDAVAQAEGRQGKDSPNSDSQQQPAKGQEPATPATTASVPAPPPAPSPEAGSSGSGKTRAEPASQEGGTPPPRQAPTPTNRNTAKAEAKLQKALDYLLEHNEQTENRDEKWVITEGLLFSLTGSFNPAIRRFFAARQDQIEDHNRKHGLTIGHNRGRSRKDPNALPRLVQGFRENVLNEHLAPNPESPSPSPIPAAKPVTSVNPSGTAVSESENPVSSSVETLKPVSLVPLWRLSLPGSHMISVAYGALDEKGIAYFSVQPFGEGVLAEALRSNRSDNLAQHTQLILHQDHHLAPITWLMVQVPHQQPFLRRIQNRIRKEAKATTRRVRDPNIEPF